MANQYTAWLLSLGTKRADLTGPFNAVRGQAISHTITYPGDVTASVLAGTVKASPDATAELLTFTIGTPSFAGGVTTWTATIAEDWTFPVDVDGDGVTYAIYDFTLDDQRIIGGLFEVSGFVTENA